FTLDVLGKVGFGFDFNNLGDPNNVYVTAYNDVQKAIMNPLLFDDIIKEKHKALAAGKSQGDLLELMNVQEKAREEVLRILGNNLILSAEQHKSLKYLNMIILENLRLYLPISISLHLVPSLIPRTLTEDLKIKDFVIPAVTAVELFLYGIHHSPKIWNNPEEFLPERFENEHKNSENYSWLAFSDGSRMCLGNNFSLIEQRIVLCLLLRKYKISLAPNSIHKDRLKTQFRMMPYSIELILKRRD
ncbi:14287_t:CDS:2, partial [Racocetra persica]